jgi:hypothetical protein
MAKFSIAVKTAPGTVPALPVSHLGIAPGEFKSARRVADRDGSLPL